MVKSLKASSISYYSFGAIKWHDAQNAPYDEVTRVKGLDSNQPLLIKPYVTTWLISAEYTNPT